MLWVLPLVLTCLLWTGDGTSVLENCPDNSQWDVSITTVNPGMIPGSPPPSGSNVNVLQLSTGGIVFKTSSGEIRACSATLDSCWPIEWLDTSDFVPLELKVGSSISDCNALIATNQSETGLALLHQVQGSLWSAQSFQADGPARDFCGQSIESGQELNDGFLILGCVDESLGVGYGAVFKREAASDPKYLYDVNADGLDGSFGPTMAIAELSEGQAVMIVANRPVSGSPESENGVLVYQISEFGHVFVALVHSATQGNRGGGIMVDAVAMMDRSSGHVVWGRMIETGSDVWEAQIRYVETPVAGIGRESLVSAIHLAHPDQFMGEPTLEWLKLLSKNSSLTTPMIGAKVSGDGDNAGLLWDNEGGSSHLRALGGVSWTPLHSVWSMEDSHLGQVGSEALFVLLEEISCVNHTYAVAQRLEIHHTQEDDHGGATDGVGDGLDDQEIGTASEDAASGLYFASYASFVSWLFTFIAIGWLLYIVFLHPRLVRSITGM